MKNMMELYGTVAAMDAADRSGLLSALAEAPATSEALANRLGLDPRATAQVLSILVAMGAARGYDGTFEATPELTTFLSAEHRLDSRALFAHVPAWLATGAPILEMQEPAEREANYRRVTPALGRMFRDRAEQLAAALHVKPRTILDVGCGSGIWSLAIAARHPDARVTGLDLPAVLDGFRTFAEERGLAPRVDTLAGDIHDVTLPPAGSFDLVIVANVLRIESAPRARHIIERIAPLTADGGAILVVDALAGGTPERDLAREIYAMHLALRSREGRVHEADTIRAWLREAGFQQSTAIDIADDAVAAALIFTR